MTRAQRTEKTQDAFLQTFLVLAFVILQLVPWFALGTVGRTGVPDKTIELAGAVVALAYLVVTFRVWRSVTTPTAGRRAPFMWLLRVGCGLNMFVALFANLYWQMQPRVPMCFIQTSSGANAAGPPTRADLVYFTVTTLTTTGFGDIHASAPACRLAVALQMVSGFGIVSVALGIGIASFRSSVPYRRYEDTRRGSWRRDSRRP